MYVETSQGDVPTVSRLEAKVPSSALGLADGNEANRRPWKAGIFGNRRARSVILFSEGGIRAGL